MAARLLIGILLCLAACACEPRAQALQVDLAGAEDGCEAIATTGDAYRHCLEVGPERFARRL